MPLADPAERSCKSCKAPCATCKNSDTECKSCTDGFHLLDRGLTGDTCEPCLKDSHCGLGMECNGILLQDRSCGSCGSLGNHERWVDTDGGCSKCSKDGGNAAWIGTGCEWTCDSGFIKKYNILYAANSLQGYYCMECKGENDLCGLVTSNDCTDCCEQNKNPNFSSDWTGYYCK